MLDVSLGLELVFEVLVIGLFFYFFKPRIRYLFYGFLFFFVGLLLQMPFGLVFAVVKKFFDLFAIGELGVLFVNVAVLLFVKFLSISRFIRVKKFSDAMFFAIGWVCLESINFFTVLFFNLVSSFLNYEVGFTHLLNLNLNFLGFVFGFMLNLALMVFVVLTIVKDDLRFLGLGIFFAWVFEFGFFVLDGLDLKLFEVFVFVLCCGFVFYHKRENLRMK